MEKIFLLINENIVHIALSRETLIAHVESVRKENCTTEVDYLSRHKGEPSHHGKWQTREITSEEDVMSYYSDIMEGYDYSSLVSIDYEKNTIHYLIGEAETSFPWTVSFKNTVSLFSYMGMEKRKEGGIFQAEVKFMDEVDTIKDQYSIAINQVKVVA